MRRLPYFESINLKWRITHAQHVGMLTLDHIAAPLGRALCRPQGHLQTSSTLLQTFLS